MSAVRSSHCDSSREQQLLEVEEAIFTLPSIWCASILTWAACAIHCPPHAPEHECEICRAHVYGLQLHNAIKVYNLRKNDTTQFTIKMDKGSRYNSPCLASLLWHDSQSGWVTLANTRNVTFHLPLNTSLWFPTSQFSACAWACRGPNLAWVHGIWHQRAREGMRCYSRNQALPIDTKLEELRRRAVYRTLSVAVSRAPVASSRNARVGSWRSILANATLCCSPKLQHDKR